MTILTAAGERVYTRPSRYENYNYLEYFFVLAAGAGAGKIISLILSGFKLEKDFIFRYVALRLNFPSSSMKQSIAIRGSDSL